MNQEKLGILSKYLMTHNLLDRLDEVVPLFEKYPDPLDVISQLTPEDIKLKECLLDMVNYIISSMNSLDISWVVKAYLFIMSENNKLSSYHRSKLIGENRDIYKRSLLILWGYKNLGEVEDLMESYKEDYESFSGIEMTLDSIQTKREEILKQQKTIPDSPDFGRYRFNNQQHLRFLDIFEDLLKNKPSREEDVSLYQRTIDWYKEGNGRVRIEGTLLKRINIEKIREYEDKINIGEQKYGN